MNVFPGVFSRPGTMEGSHSGAFGHPTLASAALGEAVPGATVEDLADGLCASFPEALAAGRN